MNIKDKDYEMDSEFHCIYIGIIMTYRKYGVNKKVVDFGIPSSRSFLKIIVGYGPLTTP
jgi:hypothetical protein